MCSVDTSHLKEGKEKSTNYFCGPFLFLGKLPSIYHMDNNNGKRN